MLHTILLCLLVLFCQRGEEQNNTPTAKYKAPLSTQISFTISSEKRSYYVGEPIRIKMSLQNQMDEEIEGFFSPGLEVHNIQIYYRREGGNFEVFKSKRSTRSPYLFLMPKKLKPQEEVSFSEILVFNTSLNRFVLSEPGTYEFKVVYRDSEADPGGQVESNTLVVEVLPPSKNEEAFLEFYRDPKLALLMQYDKFESYQQFTDAIDQAAKLIKQFPQSVYATALKKGLIWGLQQKINDRKATKYEKQLYKSLQPPSSNEIENSVE